MYSRLFVYDPEYCRRDEVLATLCNYVERQGLRLHITVAEPKRSVEQNARLWAILTDISRQVEWPVDGKMQRLSPEDFKHILSAGLKREQRVAQGMDGGFVILGQRTSKMTKRELSDLMELATAFGIEHGVTFNEPQGEYGE